MTLQLDIPESIARSLRLPAPEVEPRLRAELAVALYAQGILSFGKASELAELSRFAFADLVTQRSIPRHYTEDDLAQAAHQTGGTAALLHRRGHLEAPSQGRGGIQHQSGHQYLCPSWIRSLILSPPSRTPWRNSRMSATASAGDLVEGPRWKGGVDSFRARISRARSITSSGER